MNALLLTAVFALASSPASDAPANALVDTQVDLHKVTDGRSCTYSRPGRCSRELEVVGQADVLVRVQDAESLTAAQLEAARDGAQLSLHHAQKCLSRVQSDDLRRGSVQVVHFADAPAVRDGAWPLTGAAFFARCIEHQTRKNPLPDGTPPLLIQVELKPPSVKGIKRQG
jgi:hypothetical protein